MGVTGYPALLIKTGGEIKSLARGYKPYDQISALVQQHLR